MAQLPGNPRVKQYTANAGDKEFIYDYKIYEDDEIIVQNGDTTLTLTTHYTVQDAGESAGGTITLVTGATDGDIITLTGNSMIERDTTFTDGGDYLASAINGEYDRLDNITKEIVTGNTQQMQLAKYSPGISVIVPDPVAGKALKWNVAETALELSTYDPDTQQAAAAISAAAALVSETNAASSETDAETAKTDAEAAASSATQSAADINAATFNHDLIPATDGSIDLGSASKRWAEVHTDALEVDANTTIGGTLDVTGNTIIDGTLSVNGSSINAYTYALYTYELAENAWGGPYTTASTWQPRPINIEVYDTIGCTLDTNRITVPAGTYTFSFTFGTYYVGHVMWLLKDYEGGGTEIMYGNGNDSPDTGNVTTEGQGLFTVSTSSAIGLEMKGSLARTLAGMGYPSDFTGYDEVYLSLLLTKIA